MTNTIIYTDASRIAELIAERELSPVEVMQAHLDRIAAVNPKVNGLPIGVCKSSPPGWRNRRCLRSPRS